MPARPLSDAAVRTMHLVAVDSTNLLRRLEERHLEMVSAFGRLRDREGLLAPMRNVGLTARFEDLAVLSPQVQDAVVAFYEQVDELRWYFQFTTDMPGTLAERFTAFRRRLQTSHEALARTLEQATSEEAPPAPKPAGRRKTQAKALPAKRK